MDQVTAGLVTRRSLVGPVLRVVFAVANTPRDVLHQLGVIPDGYEILLADAEIHATPGALWTPTRAYLQANGNNARALLRFYTINEEPTDA